MPFIKHMDVVIRLYVNIGAVESCISGGYMFKSSSLNTPSASAGLVSGMFIPKATAPYILILV